MALDLEYRAKILNGIIDYFVECKKTEFKIVKTGKRESVSAEVGGDVGLSLLVKNEPVLFCAAVMYFLGGEDYWKIFMKSEYKSCHFKLPYKSEKDITFE